MGDTGLGNREGTLQQEFAHPYRRHRNHRRQTDCTECIPNTALHHRNGNGRRRRAANEIPIPGPATQRGAPEPGAASPDGVRDSTIPRRAGFPGGGDAGADRLHARRGTRLHCPITHEPGRVLRPATVAPALQTAADGIGFRPILPDREVFSRRGPEGRPPAGVHAD